jgi:two-component sensor histidine kinase
MAKKKTGVGEVILLVFALIVFGAAFFGLFRFPLFVTAILFCTETVLFLILIMSFLGKLNATEAKETEEKVCDDGSGLGLYAGGPENVSFEVPAEEDGNVTVVSAPDNAAVGAGTGLETVVKTEVIETVREVTKLKTVLFNEELLEEKEQVDMGSVVGETLEIMDPFATAAGIRTGYVCSGDVTYTGSRMLLSVMMKNIVDNAVKYMRRAGSLHITVSNVADDIFIVCKDDGLGIGKDELPYIFDLNFQGSNRVSGNGLGLTQARDIVNAYGGTIYAKSAPGAGMGIYIQLPGNSEK